MNREVQAAFLSFSMGGNHTGVRISQVFKDAVLSTLSRVKQTTSPGWMHETSARAWCTGKTQWVGVGREAAGGIRMGNTCKSMANSCQCTAKTTTIL